MCPNWSHLFWSTILNDLWWKCPLKSHGVEAEVVNGLTAWEDRLLCQHWLSLIFNWWISLPITLQCKPAGAGHFCWPWESWGISVRRYRLTSSSPQLLSLLLPLFPFPPPSLCPSTPLLFLLCPAGPTRGLQPRQPTDDATKSTLRHALEHSYYVLKASALMPERGILAS